MKQYIGKRIGHAVEVTVDGAPLEPRLELWNHSPGAFEWGYSGSGPAQLALALLADCFGDDEAAVELHQDFKAAVVAGMAYAGWTLTEEEIRDTIAAMENP